MGWQRHPAKSAEPHCCATIVRGDGEQCERSYAVEAPASRVEWTISGFHCNLQGLDRDEATTVRRRMMVVLDLGRLSATGSLLRAGERGKAIEWRQLYTPSPRRRRGYGRSFVVFLTGLGFPAPHDPNFANLVPIPRVLNG